MTTKTKRILGGLVGLAVIGAVVGFSVTRDSRSRTTVQTGKVEKRDLVQVVTASGEVRPKRYVDVGANVSGRLIEISVKEGDPVKQGQVLARVESERYQAGLRQSEAGVAAARADLQRAEADVAASKLAYDRTKKMREDKLVSDQVFPRWRGRERHPAQRRGQRLAVRRFGRRHTRRRRGQRHLGWGRGRQYGLLWKRYGRCDGQSAARGGGAGHGERGYGYADQYRAPVRVEPQ